MTILHDIRADSCGCDAASLPNALISVDEALRRIEKQVSPIDGVETLPLSSATGRVLARPVRAAASVPPFDNAAMDGYAVERAALSGDGPWRLPVVARVPAGSAPVAPMDPQGAVRIFTGAPVPHGADAVIRQEDVARCGDDVIIGQRPPAGLNIRRAGSDMRMDQVALEAGMRLGPREIAACAAAGAQTLRLRRALRVGLLVTGNEIRHAGSAREAARIWDVNTPMLRSALTTPEVEIVQIRQGSDDRVTLQKHLKEMAAKTDLVITTGGISVGEEDHVKPIMAALGADIHFSGVAIKPGKPVSFGHLGPAAWLGLPGNPLAAFVTWQIFGEFLLDALLGRRRGTRKRRHVVTAQPIHRKAGRCELRPGHLTGFDAMGREVVTLDDKINSACVAGLPRTDGLVFIPAETEQLPTGALLEFLPLA